MFLLERPPRVADVAARAGVSTATVDRVMHRRGGVHAKTVARVEAALQAIRTGGGALAAASRKGLRFDVILPRDGGMATRTLGEAMQVCASGAGGRIHLTFVERMNPDALADRMRTCVRRGSAGIAVQGPDHLAVREALAEAGRAGTPVVTVLTDIPAAGRLGYVGLDNRAAGRTAGHLMGKFCHKPGKLAIVWGGQLYRSHEERESGFRTLLRAERADLQCLDVISADDDPAEAYARVEAILARHRDLVGVYCVGGGADGVAAAIVANRPGQSPVVIAHNCTAETRPHLLSGVIDAVIHQDMMRIAAQTLACLATGNSPAATAVPIEIITRESLPQDFIPRERTRS